MADRFPCRVGLVDERGALTFGQVHERANALANSMAERGVAAGDTVAIMCRNHRGFVEATVAAARLGTDVVSLDPALPTSQLEGVLKSSAPAALVFDEDFTKLLAGVDVGLRVLAWHDGDAAGSDTVESLVRRGDVADLPVPPRRSHTVIPTPGTVGSPAGGSRRADCLLAAASLLPLRGGRTLQIAAPLFHAWGSAHLQLGLLLGSTLVLRRDFDPFDCLETASIQASDSLVVTPEMMRRVLALPGEVRQAFDLDSVQVVTASCSPLPGDRWPSGVCSGRPETI